MVYSKLLEQSKMSSQFGYKCLQSHTAIFETANSNGTSQTTLHHWRKWDISQNHNWNNSVTNSIQANGSFEACVIDIELDSICIPLNAFMRNSVPAKLSKKAIETLICQFRYGASNFERKLHGLKWMKESCNNE